MSSLVAAIWLVSAGGETVRADPPAPGFVGSPWRFAVLSDLHISPGGAIPPVLDHVVTEVIAARPRFVVITGDFTDGNEWDPPWRVREAPLWWQSALRVTARFRSAGIPVLPIAGNHDSYLSIYREDYAEAWRDLELWASPLHVAGRPRRSGVAVDALPFCYGVDVDDVHLTLAYIVDEALEPGVASWIADDLAAAQGARLRIVFGHVPMSSIVAIPSRSFVSSLGHLLDKGRANLYVAGHEHLYWNEDISRTEGRPIHQVIVGTASAPWWFAPSAASRERAHCSYVGEQACCEMPYDQTRFELHRDHGHWLESDPYTFALFTVDGEQVTTHAVTVSRFGAAEPLSRSHLCDDHP